MRTLLDVVLASIAGVSLLAALLYRDERECYRYGELWNEKWRKDSDARADRYFAALAAIKQDPRKPTRKPRRTKTTIKETR